MNLKIINLINIIFKDIYYKGRVKFLNLSIEDMTIEEKLYYLEDLLIELNKKPDNLKRIVEIIDTIHDSNISKLPLEIWYFIEERKILSKEDNLSIFKELYLRYTSKDKKIQDLINFKSYLYSKIATDILENVIDCISKDEIEFMLLESDTENYESEMELLLSKGFDLDYIYKNIDINDQKVFYYLKKIPTEKVINFIENRLENNIENKRYDFLLTSLYDMEKISKIDKIYLDSYITRGKKYIYDKMESEELIDFFIKYGKKTFELDEKFNSKILYSLIENSIESNNIDKYVDALEKIKSSILELDFECKGNLINLINEIRDEIRDENDKEKYSKLNDDEKKELLLKNSNQEELNKILEYSYLFGDILKKLPAKEIISITKRNPEVFSWLLENHNVSLEDVFELLEKKIVLNNNQLLSTYVIESKNNNINEENSKFDKYFIIKEIEQSSYDFLYLEDFEALNNDESISKFYFSFSLSTLINFYNFNNENAYNNLFFSRYLHEIEMNYDNIKLIVNILDKYYSSQEYERNGNKKFKIPQKLSLENMIKFIRDFPQKIDYIDFKLLDKDVVISLYDKLKENKYYNRELLKLTYIDKNLSEEKIINSLAYYLNSLSKEECENFNYKDFNICSKINFFEKLILPGKIDREKLFFIFENNPNFFNKLFSYQTSEQYNKNETQIFNFLKQIDKSGDLLNLYKSINEKYLKKLIESGVSNENNFYPDINMVRTEFFKNIPLIYNNKKDMLLLQKENPNLLYTINYKLLNIFNIQDLQFYSKYEQMKDIKDNIFYVEGLRKKIEYIKEHLNYPEEQVFKLLQFCSKFDSKEQADEFWEKFSVEETLEIINEKDYILNRTDKVNIQLFEDIRKFTKERIEVTLNNPNSTREEILDAYSRRFFRSSYNEIKNLVDCYGDDIDILLNRYSDDKKLSDEEKIEKNYLLHFKYIKEIINEDNCEVLKEVFKILDQEVDFTRIEYTGKLALKERLTEIYTKEKKENLYIPLESDREKDISYDGNKVKIYKPNGDFNLLISVIGAYVSKSNIDKNPYENWNQKDKNVSQDICCSIIGNDNLSMAVNNDGIKFGFFNFENYDIRAEAPYDLSSYTNKIEIYINRKPKFKTIQNLKDNIRTGHSEHLLERFIKDGNGEFKKRQPDYIISINKVREKDLRAAKEFNVPIILLNTKEISERESRKLQNLKKELLNTNEEFSVSKLKRFIVDYHNNYSGMYNLDRKSLKKFFNPKKMENSLLDITDRIINMEDINIKIKNIEDFLKIIKTEEEKYKLIERKYIPFYFYKIKEKLEKSLKEIENKNGTSSQNFETKYKTSVKDFSRDIIKTKKELNNNLRGR